MVLGFPADSLPDQEPLEGDDIAEYCQINYGVSFPMFDKVDVRGPNTHPVFRFMASDRRTANSVCGPWWNYYKFLVGRDGKVIDYWITYTQPDVPRIRKTIETAGTAVSSVMNRQKQPIQPGIPCSDADLNWLYLE